MHLAETLWCATEEDPPEQLDPVLVGEDTECGPVDQSLSLLGIVEDLQTR